MNNFSISTHNQTGFSAYIDSSTGEAYLTDSLICTLTGISDLSLAKIIQSESIINFASEGSQVLTKSGTQRVVSLRKATDLKRIIKTWKPTSQTNQERKEKVVDALMEAGATAWVYNICGYQMSLPAVEAPKILTRVELAELYLEQAKTIEAQEQLLIAQAPKVQFAESIEKLDKTVSMGEMGMMLGIGRTTFFKKLRGEAIVQVGRTVPYQQYIDRGYFVVTEDAYGFVYTRVTGKGQLWLQQQFGQVA
jgi:phage antirepressor YoqD-like protein